MLWESENRAEQCRILQIGTVDAGNGTLFGTRNKRAIQRDHLTLVIGSGGMGAAAIHAAVQKARQNLVSDFDNYTKFILVDSDRREIDRMEKEQIKTLNISTPGAAERLRCDDRKNFFRAFVPRDYDNFKLGPNGADVDRMTGKIKFYDNAMGGSTNDTKFRNIIGEIFNTDWSDRRNLLVDIIIVAGLSGGTGSGTFEELAVHAREACIYSGAPVVRVFGYLFLPDTVEAFVQANPEALSAIYANGYAALKELESYMSIPASPGRTEKFYSGDGVTTMKCNSDTPLFDCPVLISETYEESIRMMADLIVNLSTSGIVGMNSFYANIPTARFSYLNGNNLTTGGVLKNNVFPEDSRRYCGIGYAYAAIPKELVTANIVGNVCQKFYQTDETGRHFCTEENRMSRAEMETQIRRLFGFGTYDELNEMSLWDLKLKGALERCSRLPDNPVDITPHEVLAGNISAYMRGFQASVRIVEGTWELRSYLVDQVRLFKENARQVIRDYGPKAIELLYKGGGPYNQDGMLESYPELSIENIKTLCRFDTIAETNYTPIEKKLAQMNWKILMAFKKFTNLNFDELERIAKEKQISADRNELNMLLKKNGEELRKLGKKLKTDFIDPAGEDREPEDAIRWCLKLKKDDEEFYVKTLVNMYEILKEFTPEQKMETVPEKGWDCPECGRHNDADFTICPKCGTPKRKKQDEIQDWDCPKCGRHNDADFAICPKCGTKRN